MADSPSVVKEHTAALIYLLENLGFIVNYPKSLLSPTQEIEILGFIVNSVAMEIKVPGNKIKQVRSEAKKLLEADGCKAIALSRLLGKLNHVAQAIPPAPLFYRNLQSCLQKALETRGGRDYSVPAQLTASAIEELKWWQQHLTRWNGRGLIAQSPDLTIETDASTVGWGALCQGTRTGGPWSPTERMRHKLPGATGSHSCSEVFCQGQTEHHNPPEGGQHDSHGIHKQVWGNSLPRTEPAHERVVAVVPGEEYKSTGHPLSGHPELHSRRGVPGDEGQDRLDALSTCVQQDMSADRPTTSGSLCVTPDQPAEQLRQLETRSGSSGNRRLFPRLDTVPGVCKPTMELGGKGPVSCQEPEGRCGVSSTGVEITSMVPHATGNVGSTTTPLTRQTKPNPADSQSQQARHNPHTSRMGYLRDRFQSQKLSEGATTLLLASWREKTAKSYDSLFSKWISWCNERGSDPISGDIHEVVNFLAHLFQQGYQYRSLNSYRSAISSVHEKVDGYEVGQHPLVTRLIKGAFHERPPQPRYSATWDVSQVTAYLESMGNNDNLPNDQLTHKTVILLALTRPSRSTDLANLDLDHRRYSPEGVTFIPTKLAKQSKQSKPLTEFFFPCFPGNKLLCPVTTLRAYEERTKGKRGDHNRAQLFIALIKPHNPVTSPTIARWIRTILSKAGIDTDTFKAHSTRSAAVSTAASIGLTTNDILNAADWSSESVFRKFYYRPEAKNTFGIAVLSKQATTKS